MKLTNEEGVPTRRAVLTGLGLGAVALAGAGSALPIRWSRIARTETGGWWNATYPSLRHGGLAEWSKLVGQRFNFIPEAGSRAIYKIRSVTALPSPGRPPEGVARSQAFAVTFESNIVSRVVEGNRMIQMTHAAHAPFPIFVGPTLREGDRTLLVAIFN